MDVLERAEFEVKTFGHPSKESGLNMMLEITRLRQLLSEAEKREREARAKALEEAAKACVAEDRHGPWQRTNAGFHFARVVSALQSEASRVTSK